MKAFLLASISFFFLQTTYAQVETIDFEGSLLPIEIDTSNAGNIWQIGTPNKVLFDSAYSVPNAIVTDTINYYPLDNQSSFTVGFEIYGSQTTIDFSHKFDTDSAMDGGYVEVSYDQGNTWVPITSNGNWTTDVPFPFDTYNFYSETDTLSDGTPAFNGTSNGWINSQIVFWCIAIKTSFPFHLRFTFRSDTVQTENEGWMIDNININHQGSCSGIKEYSKQYNGLTVTPNPIDDQAIFQVIDNRQIHNGTMTICDMVGRSVETLQGLIGNRINYDATGLKSGIYSYHLVDENRFSASGKFVVK